ncbi:ubiquitin carboxyl-terminal hydrolase 29-like isoform X2 [Ictalurus furcatus]|uniref:ubiquitin carboxyl-terminal hydrolase 29-like isoform X2 n=1 Tax=Ictalurus furcatus TaxID=66913 RepID=UPI0023509CFF|nr:ubiquitin carboxyl-terminal hydrolase 29-like isoform X2 [Ictalurus furcatus]
MEKVPSSVPVTPTESSETPTKTLQTVSMKLLAGSTLGQTSKTNKKTSPSCNEKSAERKQVSVKPTSNLPGTNLQNSSRITSMMVERNKIILYGQEKKTAARKETASNRLNMKTAKVSESPTSKLPGMKFIRVKEAHVRTNLQNSVGTRKKMTMPSQERKEERKEMTPSNLENEMVKLNKELKELTFSSYMKFIKGVPDPYAFSSNEMMPKGSTNCPTPTASGGTIKRPTPTACCGPIKSLTPTASGGTIKRPTPTASCGPIKSPTPTTSGGTIKRLTPTTSGGTIKSPTPTVSGGTIKSPTPTASWGTIKSPTPTASWGTIKSPTPTASWGTVKSPTPTASWGTVKSQTPTASWGTVKSQTPTASGRTVKSLTPTASCGTVKRLTPTAYGRTVKGPTPTASWGTVKSPTPTASGRTVNSPIPTASWGTVKSPTPTASWGTVKSQTPNASGRTIKGQTPILSEGNIQHQSPTPSDGIINIMTPICTLFPDTDSELLPGGLPNYGNSCYVNASLQCLFTAESFCRELSDLLDNSTHTLKDTFLRCFVELSRLRKGSEVEGDSSKDLLLLALIESAAVHKPEFTIDNQNDAHEFLCYCLTQMEESGRKLGWQEDVNPRCPVTSNFKFKMRNIITCSSCGSQQNNKVEVFNHVPMPLKHDSVDQCLSDVVNKLTLLESKCEVCGGESAISRWKFHTLPRFLILQLNRFKMTEYHTVEKLVMPVDITPELQINCFPHSDMPGIENSRAEARETDRNELGGSTSTYRLISVLSHIGSTACYGHYVSECSSGTPTTWKTYDDKLVTLTSETDMLERRLTSAYVLLYERVSTG